MSKGPDDPGQQPGLDFDLVGVVQSALLQRVKANGVVPDRRERTAFLALDQVRLPVDGDERDAVFSGRLISSQSCSAVQLKTVEIRASMISDPCCQGLWREWRKLVEILALEIVIGEQLAIQHDAKDAVGTGRVFL